jgi:hypothetical protein
LVPSVSRPWYEKAVPWASSLSDFSPGRFLKIF